MAWKRITFVLGVACLALAGCGGGGGSDSSIAEGERESDVALLNSALAQELTLADALAAGLPLLNGESRATVEELRAQEQEHADALLKAIRRLGGESEAEASELEMGALKSPADFYSFAYEQASSTVASHMSAIPKLAGGHSRVMFAAIAANEAQQLVLLRKALGAGPLEQVPNPFETGATPPPGEEQPQG